MLRFPRDPPPRRVGPEAPDYGLPADVQALIRRYYIDEGYTIRESTVRARADLGIKIIENNVGKYLRHHGFTRPLSYYAKSSAFSRRATAEIAEVKARNRSGA